MLIATSWSTFAAEPAEQPAAETAPTITAVHKAQELSFSYRSTQQFYSCHDLEQRVAVMLVAIGARDDIDVKARNCDAFMVSSGDRSMDIDPYGRNGTDPLGRDRSDPFGRDASDPWGRSGSSGSFGRYNDSDREQTATVRIKLMMPVEVTPQILKEIEKDKSRRELVSRVTRNPAASMNDPVVFAARREEVTLSQQTIRLRAEDCNLLQQLTTQVIRKLDVRVKNQSFGCSPRSSSKIAPRLTVETLLPTGALLPMPDPEKMKGASPPSNGGGSNEPPANESATSNPETQASESPPQ